MATVSHLNQFPCKTLPLTLPRYQSKTLVPVSSSGFRLRFFEGLKNSIRLINLPRPVFRVKVASDDEWGPDKDEPDSQSMGRSAVSVTEEPLDKPEDSADIAKLKKALMDSFYGTDRGLRASSETRAEVVELITQLESRYPTPLPSEALALLNGKWILAYTSFSGLFPLLSRGTLPLVKVKEISQTIDSDKFTVQNSVQFASPLTTTSFITNGKFEVRSPRRVEIKFVEGVIGTPQLTDSIEIPENVECLGQNIDLEPFRGLFTSIQDTTSSVVRTISRQPPLKFSISNTNAKSWLITTYLDEDLRISKGDVGNVFVLIKERSSLLTS